MALIFKEQVWKKESEQYIDLFERTEFKTEDTRKTVGANRGAIISKNAKFSQQLSSSASKCLVEKNWSKAMDFCNESLRYADPDSEEASLVYCYRSVCFFKLGKYSECLTDIKLARLDAFEILSEDQLLLLRDYEQCSLEILEKRDPISEISENLSFESDASYPGMANVLVINTNKEFGRLVVAKCDISVGKTVLMEEHFMQSTAANKFVCETCFRTDMNFIACDFCSTGLFCDKECKKANQIHQIDCNTLGEFVSTEDFTLLKLIRHSIMFAVSLFPSSDELIRFVEQTLNDREALPKSIIDSKSKYGAFLSLHPCKAGIPISTLYMAYKELCSVEIIRYRFTSTEFLLHLIGHHALILLGNQIKVDDLGATVGIVASLLNHSCAPNLISRLHHKCRYFTTVRPVKKGEQLFISYLSNFDGSIEARQQHLKKEYGFECHCEKCETEFKETKQKMMSIEPTNRAKGSKEELKTLEYEPMGNSGSHQSESLNYSELALITVIVAVLAYLQYT